MSAFVVNDKTISRIISYVDISNHGYGSNLQYLYGIEIDTEEKKNELGTKLLAMNVEAVKQRYGPSETLSDPRIYHYRFELVSRIQTYKSLACFLYQCSEGDVLETDLYKAMAWLKHAMAHDIIADMPEYQKAEWD